MHVTFAGSGGDAVDETLRLGSFSFEKMEGRIELGHVSTLRIDELSNHQARARLLRQVRV